jgi:hypothetical protein
MDLQQVATRAYSRDARNDSKSYGAVMLPHLADVTPDGIDRESNLPHGLAYFLHKYGEHLTMREKLFMSRARFKFDGTLWMDDQDWFLFLKLIVRGYYLGQAEETPPDALERLEKAQARLTDRRRETRVELAIDAMDRIKDGRWLPVHRQSLEEYIAYAERLAKTDKLTAREKDTLLRVKNFLEEPMPPSRYVDEKGRARMPDKD